MDNNNMCGAQAEGSREWAIAQLDPGFGGVMDPSGRVWYKPSDGVGYRRVEVDGDTCFDELPTDMPDGWALVT